MSTDRVDAAISELYRTEPGDFVACRSALAAAAKRAGDAAAGTAIAALKRPTMPAWMVNVLVRSDTDAVETMRDLGDRMRGAQRALDAAELRELSRERRRAVADLVRRATGRRTTSAAVTAEVTATIEAAIADAGVLDEVASGRLLKAAHFSGFGFDGPGLHVVPDPPAPSRATATAAPPRRSGSAAPTLGDGGVPTLEERRQQERHRQEERRRAALEAAERDAAAAEQAATEAADVEEQAGEAVRVLAERLAEAKRMLDEARLDRRQAENRRRKATDALKRFRR
ncbi:MAG: hypothetical protein ACR2F6_12310 [Mycobacteriales bacterium]